MPNGTNGHSISLRPLGRRPSQQGRLLFTGSFGSLTLCPMATSRADADTGHLVAHAVSPRRRCSMSVPNMPQRPARVVLVIHTARKWPAGRRPLAATRSLRCLLKVGQVLFPVTSIGRVSGVAYGAIAT